MPFFDSAWLWWNAGWRTRILEWIIDDRFLALLDDLTTRVEKWNRQGNDVHEKTWEERVEKAKVLFLCTGNSARSQMAEAFLRHRAGDRFAVYSAGMEPKGINPYTVRVMEERGLSLDGHRSKPLTEYMGKVDFDYLITVCSDADERCPFFPGMGRRLHWGFEDPAAFLGTEEETLAKFRAVRDQIDERISGWLKEEADPAAGSDAHPDIVTFGS